MTTPTPPPITFVVRPITDAPWTQSDLPPVQWTDLVGNHHAKRALEVAWAGNHRLLFVGTPQGQTQELALWARSKGIDATATQSCPCGNYRHPTRECTCSLDMVADWQASHLHQGQDITIETPDLRPREVVAHLMGRSVPENESALRTRVENARPYTDLTLTEDGERLLATAISQLQMTPSQIRSTLNVARTIANLSRDRTIAVQHLAEDIQYRPR